MEMGVIGFQGSLQRRPLSFIVCSADVYRGKGKEKRKRKEKKRQERGIVKGKDHDSASTNASSFP